MVDILISLQALNRELTLVSKDTDFLKIKKNLQTLKFYILSNARFD